MSLTPKPKRKKPKKTNEGMNYKKPLTLYGMGTFQDVVLMLLKTPPMPQTKGDKKK